MPLAPQKSLVYMFCGINLCQSLMIDKNCGTDFCDWTTVNGFFSLKRYGEKIYRKVFDDSSSFRKKKKYK